MSEFHFLRPAWLLLLLPLLWLLMSLWRHRGGAGIWREICDPALLEPLLQAGHGRQGAGYLLSAGVAAALAIVALAGPVWERVEQPAFREQSALVILLDMSGSMNVSDLKPNRMARARYKIDDLLQQRRGGQTALVVYAGYPFTVTPLTDDVATIQSQLNALETDLMPVPGSRVDLGTELAVRLLQQAGQRQGDILLVSDGISDDDRKQVLTQLAGSGYRLSVLAVGTPEGAPVPHPDGGLLKDKQGNIMLSRLELEPLAALAREAGGKLQLLASDDRDIQQLQALFASTPTQIDTAATTEVDEWQESGPWLLLPVLLVAAAGFRRGILLVLLLPVCLLPKPAAAFEWADLWLTADQQAARQFDRNPAAAAQIFEDRRWRAAGHYQSGDYAAALEALPEPQNADDWYNRGNTEARQGDYQAAIESYDQALQLDQRHEDARHNRELVEQQLQQQQAQNGEGQSQSDEGGEQQQQDQQGQGDGRQQGEGAQAGQQPGASDQTDTGDSQRQTGESSDATDPGQSSQSSATKAEHSPSETRSSEETDAGSNEAESANSPEQTAAQADAQSAKTGQQGSEGELATEQWLQRIPDDPGGLLRRKFKHQYQQLKYRQTEN